MSQRTAIKAALITNLEGVDRVRRVEGGRWRDIHEVDTSQMPYIQDVSSEETREKVNSQKDTECEWEHNVWCYVEDYDQVEKYVEELRDHIMSNRGLGGLQYVLDTFIRRILVDDGQYANPHGIIMMQVVVTYRVDDS